MSSSITCPTGKFRHATHADALKAIGRKRSRSLGVGKCGPGQLRPYPCPICKGYHVGSPQVSPPHKRATARRSS